MRLGGLNQRVSSHRNDAFDEVVIGFLPKLNPAQAIAANGKVPHGAPRGIGTQENAPTTSALNDTWSEYFDAPLAANLDCVFQVCSKPAGNAAVRGIALPGNRISV